MALCPTNRRPIIRRHSFPADVEICDISYCIACRAYFERALVGLSTYPENVWIADKNLLSDSEKDFVRFDFCSAAGSSVERTYRRLEFGSIERFIALKPEKGDLIRMAVLDREEVEGNLLEALQSSEFARTASRRFLLVLPQKWDPLLAFQNYCVREGVTIHTAPRRIRDVNEARWLLTLPNVRLEPIDEEGEATSVSPKH